MSGDQDHDNIGANRSLDVAQGHDDEPVLDVKIQQQLGLILSQYSQDLLSQPVPDSFLALLARLEARERQAR
jgi:hypothetical protein